MWRPKEAWVDTVILSLFGLIGSACFAFAAVPTAFKCARAGENVGAPKSIAWLIFTGVVVVYTYLFIKFFLVSGIDWVITTTYLIEGLAWGTILWYTYFPRRKHALDQTADSLC